ncbi:MAG: type II toxin-antitoxin system death-on-curing family toxin [Pseudomonadota bacterium]
MSWRWVKKQHVLAAHDRSLADHGGAEGVRDEGALESALARPENMAAYGEPDIFDLAALYAVGIAKNHPFVDGNKRTAFYAGNIFLMLNGYVLIADERDATIAMVAVAAGDMSEQEFAGWLRKNAEPSN